MRSSRLVASGLRRDARRWQAVQRNRLIRSILWRFHALAATPKKLYRLGTVSGVSSRDHIAWAAPKKQLVLWAVSDKMHRDEPIASAALNLRVLGSIPRRLTTFSPRSSLPVASGLRHVLPHSSSHSQLVAATAPSTRYALRHRDPLSEADEDMANPLLTGPHGRSARSGARAWIPESHVRDCIGE
jgi:hypothetical protein